MARVGYDPRGGRIKTDARRVTIDRAFLAHYQVKAADAVALSAAGVMPLATLGAAASEVTAGLTSPAICRSLSIVGSEDSIAGNVKITGKNYAGETIDETIALNAETPVNGDKAFKEVTKVELPARTNAPQAQTKTIECTNACTTAGDLTATFTSALYEDPLEIVIAVDDTDHDTATKVAAEVVEVLNDDEHFDAHFEASNTGAVITITAKAADSNDDTLDIEFAVGSTNVTFGSSGDGDAGRLDKVSVGWGNKLGLPYKLAHNTVLKTYLNNALEGTDPTVAVHATNIESNTAILNTALNGSVVDIYLIV